MEYSLIGDEETLAVLLPLLEQNKNTSFGDKALRRMSPNGGTRSGRVRWSQPIPSTPSASFTNFRRDFLTMSS